jgi:hypothetical protein
MKCSDGYAISPRWREVLVFLGQEVCYGKGAEELGLLFGLPVSQAQIHRLTQHYGQCSEMLLEEEQPVEAISEREVVYAEVDGSGRRAAWCSPGKRAGKR